MVSQNSIGNGAWDWLMSLSSFKPFDLDLLFFLVFATIKKYDNNNNINNISSYKKIISIILNDMIQIKK